MTRPRIEPESQSLDEVDLPVGPDRDALGLFDAPTTGTSTGEHTHGSSVEPERGGGQRRTAVLAWIAAQDLDGPAPEDPAPCAAVKRLIADEPLDVVPALDGTPERAAAPHSAVEGEREDTATQILGFDALVARADRDAPTQTDVVAPRPSPEPARRAPSPAVMLALALCALIAAWFLLFIR